MIVVLLKALSAFFNMLITISKRIKLRRMLKLLSKVIVIIIAVLIYEIFIYLFTIL